MRVKDDKEPAGGRTCWAHADASGEADPPTLSAQLQARPQAQPPAQAPALRVTAEFDAVIDQVRHARHFAEAMLRDWPVASDAAMIVSEFTANAALHSAGSGKGKFWVHLEAYPGQYAWAEVRDQGGPWLRREHDDGRPHGLEIVGALADDFGVDGDERSGWIAWAHLELPEPSAAEATRATAPPGGQGSAGNPAPAANGHAGRPAAAVPEARPARRGSS